MNMKTLQTFLSVLVLGATTSYGGIYYNSSPGVTIPDGSPGGYQNSINVSGLLPTISSVLVYMNVSGGYNGDLYAYLNLGGTSVVLLNRIGAGSGNPFGSSSSGFGGGATWHNDGVDYSFRLADGSSSVHGASGSPVEGTYGADGGSLSSFNGANPNGNWTIFFADMASGPGTSTSSLVSWGLEITAVPEPVNVALGLFGAGAGVLGLVRSRRVRAQVQRWRDGFIKWVDAV